MADTMNERKARALARGSRNKLQLLAHLVAANGPDDDIDVHELIRLQSRVLKWSRQKVLDGLQALIESGEIEPGDGAWPTLPNDSNSRDAETYLCVGARHDATLEPDLTEVARWLVAGEDPPGPEHSAGGSATHVGARRQLVLAELRDASRNGPVNAAVLAENLRGREDFQPFMPKKDESKAHDAAAITQTSSLKRLIQRDLKELVATGEAELNGHLYQATLRNHLAELARPSALLILQHLAGDTFPARLKAELTEVFAAARTEMDRFADSVSEDNRWLKAFRIVPARPELDEPIIRPEVKATVDDAILARRQVRLEACARVYPPGSTVAEVREFRAEGSISHLLLEVPGRLAIEFWPPEAESPNRIHLEDITTIHLTGRPATWPRDHEPEPIASHWTLLAGDAWHRDDGQTEFVLDVRTTVLEHFKTRRIGDLIETHDNGNGWYRVRFRARATPPLLHYLGSMQDVVVLRPITENHNTRYRMHHALANYAQCNEQALALRLEERRLEGQPEAYLRELEHCPEWRACPSLVETLVESLFWANPFGFKPDEIDEHLELGRCLMVAAEAYRRIAATEVGQPVTAFDDPGHLADLLHAAAIQHACGRRVRCDWRQLATQCRDALNDYWIYGTPHPVYR